MKETEISELVLGLLRDPVSATTLTPADWDVVLRVLRNEGLLARVHAQQESLGQLSTLPGKVQDHLVAASVVTNDHQRMIKWEVDRIRYALRHLDVPIVLLKGAAYVMADLPPANGRLVSDVDILVPEGNIPTVESALLSAGWETIQHDEYDQRYFRQWMHEIPPLRHALRRTDVDVHHAILPRTAKLKPDSTRLLASARAIDGNLCALSDADIVLHSATHLFYGGDLDHGLRDLLDLHDLLAHFSANSEQFWGQLVTRAQALDLQRPLFYALRYCKQYLHTSIPDEVIRQSSSGRPPFLITAVMDVLVKAVMSPSIPARPTALNAFRRWLLYVRSHHVRMPLNLLIPHLTRKALRRAEGTA